MSEDKQKSDHDDERDVDAPVTPDANPAANPEMNAGGAEQGGEPIGHVPLDLTQETGSEAEEKVEDEFVDLARRCADLESKLLRAHADYQNVVRRGQQEVGHARERRTMEIAKDLLTVLDHFDHAVAVDTETTSAAAVLEGVMIVRDELTRTLERFDVQRLIVEPGDEFDPNRHEALMRQASDDLESNQVVMQLQPGYLIGDKTLRPAKVSVAE